jgi:hypothetical protein
LTSSSIQRQKYYSNNTSSIISPCKRQGREKRDGRGNEKWPAMENLREGSRRVREWLLFPEQGIVGFFCI